MFRICIIIFFLLSFFSCNSPDAETDKTSLDKKECVILLHGLARTKRSMDKLEHAFSLAGYKVINVDYPSRELPIEKLSESVIPGALKICRTFSPNRIHFVTHSMGGILLRYYLAEEKIENLGRVVMLSPPNKGSEVVDRLSDFFIFKLINGPAGKQLGTDKNSIPLALGSADFELGIITGDRSINPILSMIIPGADDGKVSVKRANLEGALEFLVVHSSHPFIMRNKGVINKVIHFIEYGCFDKGDSQS